MIQNEYKPKLLYTLVDDEAHPSFLNKFKLLANNKSINYNNDEKYLIALIYNKEIRFVYL